MSDFVKVTLLVLVASCAASRTHDRVRIAPNDPDPSPHLAEPEALDGGKESP